jgi:hypothetical protein
VPSCGLSPFAPVVTIWERTSVESKVPAHGTGVELMATNGRFREDFRTEPALRCSS